MENIRKQLQTLKVDIRKRDLSDAATLQSLNLLKSQIISAEAVALFAYDDIKTLGYYAFDDISSGSQSSLVALKCLANLLLLEEKTRQMFVDGEYPIAAAKRLRAGPENQLLCSRILFLLTYKTKFDFEDLFENQGLADSIHENIVSHASKYVRCKQEIDKPIIDTSSNPLPILEPGALTETLKLLFNLNQFYPNHVADFDRTIKPILQILTSINLQVRPLQPPVPQLINALLGLDLPGPVYDRAPESREYTPLFPHIPAHNTYLRLINILGSAVRTTRDEELESLEPLVTLLRRIFELAPSNVKPDMQTQLLPSNEDRTQPLGKTDSLPSRLLRLSTSPTAPRLKEGISSFLFELSNKDAATFVRNVGYGFAAGYLMTHNLPVPSHATGDPGERLTTVDGQEINPVTGQRRDMEPQSPLPDMTDEEKEREAEKLFVLFERLKATGVMNVVNPVEQALHEGRFEEVE